MNPFPTGFLGPLPSAVTLLRYSIFNLQNCMNFCKSLPKTVLGNLFKRLKILGASREWIYFTGTWFSHQKSWKTLQTAGSSQSLSRHKWSNNWRRTNASQVALGRQILSSKFNQKGHLFIMESSGMRHTSQMKTPFPNSTILLWCLKIWAA